MLSIADADARFQAGAKAGDDDFFDFFRCFRCSRCVLRVRLQRHASREQAQCHAHVSTDL
jgi:hypothetical protein